MVRLVAFLLDVGQTWREAGLWASLRLVWSRIFACDETLLYELRVVGVAKDLPAGWHVTAVCSEQESPALDLLRRAGGAGELRNFRRKAVAYVLRIGDEPVARCWYFPNNPLARRLGPDASYFGMMFVRPEWRGQGIQGQLNRYMASLLPAGSRVVAEIVQSNVASRKGLAKAGFVCAGRLHTIVFLGQVVRARVDGSSSTL